MKTVSVLVRSALAVVFAFVMSSASCDLFDKVDDVTVPIELTHTFHVDEEAENPDGATYLQYELLDAAKVNSDFDKYKDKIQSITVTEVTYTITEVATEGILFQNGSVGFSAVSTTTAPTQIAQLGVENIDAAEGQSKVLNYQQAALDALSTLLKNDKQANVYLIGTLSKTPADFKVTVKVKANIVADAL